MANRRFPRKGDKVTLIGIKVKPKDKEKQFEVNCNPFIKDKQIMVMLKGKSHAFNIKNLEIQEG